ncbi:MAG: ATP-binding protein [Defluviitaleaceae bacterium]|nr:ATP-binding protein [Defluviitaleaceae bacterium]
MEKLKPHASAAKIIRHVILLVMLVAIVLPVGCGAQASQNTGFDSYQDIPGITMQQKQAISRLREQHEYFIYGMLQNDEAFYGADGEIIGFAARMCQWLSHIFDIPFVPVIYEDLPSLLASLSAGTVHFAGQIPQTSSFTGTYNMTDPISMRTVAIVRPHIRPDMDNIIQERLPRFAFKSGTVLHNVLLDIGAFDGFEYLHVDTTEEAVGLLQRGYADAFFGDGVLTHTIAFPDLHVEAFYPFIFGFSSFAAQDPNLFPIVDIVQKFLDEGGMAILSELFAQGMEDAKAHRMSLLLTDIELEFIENNPVIPIAVHGHSYPISFFNNWDREFQGIAHDVLRQVELITGLTFEIIHEEGLEMPQMAQMLRRGEAYLAVGVFSERVAVGGFQNPFLMSCDFFTDHYAFLSPAEMPTINISQLLYMRVGLLENNVYDVLFKHLFPQHDNLVLFADVDYLIDALEDGEVDLAFYSLRGLIRATNYFERTGIRANYVLNESYGISFAIAEGMDTLYSIINNALHVINTQAFSDDWMTRTFDFRLRLLQAQRPFLIGASVSLGLVIILLFVLFRKTQHEKRRLERLVMERTEILERESNTLNAIVDSLPDVLFYKNLEKKYVRVNKSFEALLGVNRQDIIGTASSDWMTPELAEIWCGVDLAVINEKRVIRTEAPLAIVDGNARIYDTIKTPLMQGDVVYGILALARDITERKEYEENLRAVSHAKSAFLAHMSHEIRTPMNSVMGFSELALEEEISAEARDYLARINESANSLLNIVNDILDMSKIESGKIELERVPFDAADLFTQCKNIILPKAMEKGLLLHFYAEPIAGNKLLLGDPARLRQVLLNIVSNAVKFTEHGTIKIISSVTKTTDTTTTIYWEVTDSGIGMTKDQIIRISEPFMQADSSITRKYGGTGLGIPIINGILGMLGGKLAIESTPGIGSKFSFELTFDTVESEDATQRPTVVSSIEKPHFSGEILVCEDSEMNQLVIRKHLQRFGLSCVTANNGQDGVNIVAKRMENGEKPFDLILMDIYMPIMDGLDAAAAIIKMGCPTPVVAITANVMPDDINIYRNAGMPDCIEKPFATKDLLSVLHKYLRLEIGTD